MSYVCPGRQNIIKSPRGRSTPRRFTLTWHVGVEGLAKVTKKRIPLSAGKPTTKFAKSLLRYAARVHFV